MVSQSRTIAAAWSCGGDVLESGADVVGVGEEQPGFHPQHCDAGHGLILVVTAGIGPPAIAAGHLSQYGDVRARHPVEQEQQGVSDPMNRPGSR
jgi:hypothetical protein